MCIYKGIMKRKTNKKIPPSNMLSFRICKRVAVIKVMIMILMYVTTIVSTFRWILFGIQRYSNWGIIFLMKFCSINLSRFLRGDSLSIVLSRFFYIPETLISFRSYVICYLSLKALWIDDILIRIPYLNKPTNCYIRI